MSVAANILVVDDDPNLRKTLGDILRVKGYLPVLADNGADAISAIAQTTISVALIDLMLPDMSGLQVLERIKAISPSTQTIILTGNASMETAINATKQGAFSYLIKPYQMDDLLLNIKHGVDRQQAQEEIARLASYPRLNPAPVIEIGSSGDVTYVNPAAERVFPDLQHTGVSHPLIQGLEQMAATFRQGVQQQSVREIRLNDEVYEEHIAYIADVDLIRLYVVNITDRKMAEELLTIRESEQAAIAELGSFALSENTLVEIFNHAVTLIAQRLNVRLCVVFEAHQETGEFSLRAGTAVNTPAITQSLDNEALALLAGLTRQSNEPLVWDDLAAGTDPTIHPLLKQLGAINGVTLAIGAQSKFFGVLGVFADEPRKFSKDDLIFLQAMANVLSSSVRRQRAEDVMNLLATTDTLTGIANRREFNMQLAKEIQRARRYGTQLSLVMYDIDHFKRVNDTFGHDTGDTILKAVVLIVAEHIRGTDLNARWGGEEFMILMPHTDGEGAGKAAEKLRNEIAGHSFDGVGSLSASFGVSALAPLDDVNTLLKRVDDALYTAKENGRDRVEILLENTGI